MVICHILRLLAKVPPALDPDLSTFQIACEPPLLLFDLLARNRHSSLARLTPWTKSALGPLRGPGQAAGPCLSLTALGQVNALELLNQLPQTCNA